MTHMVIAGRTLSGKTSFAKELVPVYKNAGIHSLVFDPILDPEWDADYMSDNPEEFIRTVWDNRGCAVFIDEAAETSGQHDKEFFKLATKGRHYGHRTHFLIQRYKSLKNMIRANLSEIVLFNVTKSDAKLIYEDFDYQEILNAHELGKGHYVHAKSMGGVSLGKMSWAE